MSDYPRPPAVAPLNKETLLQRLQELIKGARESWTYAIFWQSSYDMSGASLLQWGQGFYNDECEKPKKTTSLVVQEYRKKVLRNLSSFLFDTSAADALSDQEVTDPEWFVLLSTEEKFLNGGGLPGQAFFHSTPVWVAGADRLAVSPCERARRGRVFGLQTMVCVPTANGVVELGSTGLIFQSSHLMNKVRVLFDFNNLAVGSGPMTLATSGPSNHRISKPIQFNNHPSSSGSSACLPSSSSARRWKYDVFLSFRGDDTRKGITIELYDRLQRRGIKTFMDDRDLEVGDAISPTLIAAIEESRFAIIVLSQNYASSTWYLEELTKICECMKDNNRVLPLFFHVEPFDVRYQKRSFEEAFSMHETSERHGSEKVKQWRNALNKVAGFSGWNTQDYKTHRELVDVIVEFLRSKVLPDSIEFTGDFEEYEATRQAMDEVMKALTEDDVTAIGVYGMGGVGKTSMVKHVGAQACKNGIFDHSIMAAISQSPDLKRIQDTLAELLRIESWEKTEDGRAARLHKEIMRREKLLIILDDVWGRTESSKIGIPSYKELQKCKSKVLLTTRIWNVCHAMECQKRVTLSVLSKEDSWTLFVTKARRSFESTKFKGVAKKVVEECRGLPIALIAVARALGDKDLAEWEKAAQRLEKSQIANPDHDEDAFKCIRLSYDYLKDEDHKSCFLLCCLYPEDYDIPTQELFKYGFGKGLFRRDADTIQEARGTADSVVKYLKDSSLLLDSEKNGCVKMHDVIRDTALNIAKSEDEHRFLVKASCGLKDWPRGLHEGCTAISLMWNKICKLPEELVCPNLQILLLKGNADLNEVPEKFIQSLNELRVLDLSNTCISLLPQSFSLLINLQALYLDFCHNMIDISIVGKLKKC